MENKFLSKKLRGSYFLNTLTLKNELNNLDSLKIILTRTIIKKLLI